MRLGCFIGRGEKRTIQAHWACFQVRISKGATQIASLSLSPLTNFNSPPQDGAGLSSTTSSMSTPISVQLHPQASRHACAPSSSSSSSASPPSPLATTPFFPQIDTIFPEQQHNHHQQYCSRSSRGNPSPLKQNATLQHTGLQVDPNEYPLYSLSCHAPQIRVITAKQYAELHERDSKTKLDEKELFPWSHGAADVADSPAARYFGFPNGKAAKTPK